MVLTCPFFSVESLIGLKPLAYLDPFQTLSTKYLDIPVVPHKAVAEVSKIGDL